MNTEVALTLKTALSGRTIENALTAACHLPFEMVLESAAPDNPEQRNCFRIMFKSQEDCQRFRRALRRLALKPPGQERAA